MTIKLNNLSELVSIVGASSSAPTSAIPTGAMWPGLSGQDADPDGAIPLPDAAGADHAASGRPRWRERLAAAERRARDVLLSGALLVTTLPLCLVAACAIKLESPGPVLYRQTRVGLNGRAFQILKLRSMRDDAEPDGPCWAAIGDPRVTRVGSWLRRARIDELPQLLNVLRGEMSLIGPRPERPHFVRALAETLPDYERRTAVLPGITGLAQVKLPYAASVDDARRKLAWDLAYVQHRSHWLDVFILLATVRVVLLGTGAR